jgi:2-octaprenyl-6-methoxyphenol hydroxylase
MLRRYDWARRADVLSRTFDIDMANRSLLSDLLPMQSLRASGLHLMSAFAPLRRLVMQEGLAPSWRRSRHPDASDPTKTPAERTG